jgi:hypothetical protein
LVNDSILGRAVSPKLKRRSNSNEFPKSGSQPDQNRENLNKKIQEHPKPPRKPQKSIYHNDNTPLLDSNTAQANISNQYTLQLKQDVKNNNIHPKISKSFFPKEPITNKLPIKSLKTVISAFFPIPTPQKFPRLSKYSRESPKIKFRLQLKTQKVCQRKSIRHQRPDPSYGFCEPKTGVDNRKSFYTGRRGAFDLHNQMFPKLERQYLNAVRHVLLRKDRRG